MSSSASGSEIKELQHISYQLGSDPEQVQGAGGNTSIKIDELLWIKASGTWLMHACSKDLFVPVALSPLLQALRTGDPRAEKSTDFVVSERNPSNLRPSIETTVHAVLPQRVVVHVHCVDTIALACRTDAMEVIDSALAGINWLWVPYLRPGLPLSKYIDAHRKPETDVIILGNHGLVVAAESVDEAQSLLKSVRSLLKQPVRAPLPAALQKLTNDFNHSDFLPAEDPIAHSLAMDTSSVQIAAGGSLYPDHVIFLGDSTVVSNPNESVHDCIARAIAINGSDPVSIVVPDVGVLVHADANAGQHAMVRCIADVTARIVDPDFVRYLSDNEVYDLTHWEAEHYRQKLNQHESS